MSDILEKTFKFLPQVVSGGLNPVSKSVQGNHNRLKTKVRTSFPDLLSKCKTQHETDEYMKKEIKLLKAKLNQPGSSTDHINDCLVRAILCFLMGYDVSFAHIYCVKLAQQGKYIHKKVGYLASSIFFSEEDDMILMLVNTIQKDLQSSNIIDICAGLVAANELITVELIPTILPLVESKLNHQNCIVRRKAITCLHGFYNKAPCLLSSNENCFKIAFCDKNPEMMCTALPAYIDMFKNDPESYHKMIPSLAHVLDQVINQKFPIDFEHHNIPAPWLQIQLLTCLAILCKDNEDGSHHISSALMSVLQRIDPTQKMGLAVIYECVKTVGVIKPVPKLLETASQCVKKFLSAKNVNLKYLGIKCLGIIIGIDVAYAIPHQEIVIECLSHHDISIRRNVINLLYRMANQNNYKVVCQKILNETEDTSEDYSLANNVLKIMDLSERFSSDILWYIKTVNTLMQIAHNQMNDLMFNSIVSILRKADLSGNLDDVLSCYIIILNNENIPDILLKISAWVLGEFCNTSTKIDPNDIITALEEHFVHRKVSSDCKGYIVTAFIKLSCKYPDKCCFDLKRYEDLTNDNPNTVQRLHELKNYLDNKEYLKTVCFPQFKVPEVDSTLSCLDEYVMDKLDEGCKPYKPRSIRYKSPAKIPETFSTYSGLNMQSNAGCSLSGSQKSNSVSKQSFSIGSGGSQSGSYLDETELSLKLTGVKKVWGVDEEKEDTTSLQKTENNEEQFALTFLSNNDL